MRNALPLMAVMVGLFTCGGVQAATYGLKTHGDLVLSAYGVPGVDKRGDTGWQTAGPSVLDFSGHITGLANNDLFGHMHVESAFGDMKAWGSGEVTNAPDGGAFSWHRSWVGSEPNAWFYDRLTIHSDMLAAGTPVTVNVDMDLLGGFSIIGPTAVNNWTEVVAGFYVSTNSPLLTVGTSSYRAFDTHQSTSFASYVGATFNIQGKLWVSASINANGSLPPGQVGTFSTSYDTRVLTAISTSPGAYLTADSGATYVTPVPEPSLALELAAGLGLVGFAVRRRTLSRQNRASPSI